MTVQNDIETICQIYPDICKQISDIELQITLELNNEQYKQQEIVDFVDQQQATSLLEFTNIVIQALQIGIPDSTEQQNKLSKNEQKIAVTKKKHNKTPVSVRYHPCQIELKYKYPINRSQPIVVQKSCFISLSTTVKSQADVEEFLDLINESVEFQDATHNMAAWRFECNGISEAYDEDGEAQAGHKMLFLLQQMKIMDRIVVCSRFWGGIMLGPSRFKIICQSCQEALK